jgi:sugar/nucleoside kinase (ribokinase family)
MSRARTITAIGEAVLSDRPQSQGPEGLACEAALAAMHLGHRGVVISRLGQDAAGDELRSRLREADLQTDAMQSDPDLATGQIVERAFGGEARLDAHAAFDNLQWDFDLEDAAQTTDALVYGLLAMRSPQTWSTVQRMLETSSRMVRLLDATNRMATQADRSQISMAVGFAQCVLIDRPALRLLRPDTPEELTDAWICAEARHRSLQCVCVWDAQAHQLILATPDEAARCALQAVASVPWPLAGACTVLLDALLGGRALQEAVQRIAAMATHRATHADGSVPDELTPRA